MTEASAREKGLLAWMVYNRVTPNLLMIVLLLGGFLMSSKIKQEVFPAFELDIINITVPYPGAGPEEVEQTVTRPMEGTLTNVSGVKDISSTSSEGSSMILLELSWGMDLSESTN